MEWEYDFKKLAKCNYFTSVVQFWYTFMILRKKYSRRITYLSESKGRLNVIFGTPGIIFATTLEPR